MPDDGELTGITKWVVEADARRRYGLPVKGSAEDKRRRRTEAPKYDLGGGLSTDSQQDVVDLFIGGSRGADVERRLTSTQQGMGPASYDMSRYREGDLSDRQIAELFVYQAPGQNVRWRNRDGSWNNSLIYRAQQMDEAVQAALAIQPELADQPQVLWALTNEPFLAQRLRGMAKARDYLELRGEVVQMNAMPEDHQRAWWDNLDDRVKDAYRKAGYTPVAERLQVKQSGPGEFVGNAFSKLQTAAEYTGLDVPLGAVPWTLDKAFKGFGLAANTVNTAYRATVAAADQGSFDTWWSLYRQAWDGERFFRPENLAEAQEIAAGNKANLDLYTRLAAGDTFEEILDDVAEPGSTQYAEGYQFLSQFVADPRTQRAVQTLQRGKYSFGRDVAGTLLQLDEDNPWYTLVSGAADGFWALTTDPTLLAGQAYKAQRLARFGLKAADEASQASRLYRLIGVRDGQTLTRAVEAERGAASVDVFSHTYWSDLNKMNLSATQRPMVALADHMAAFRAGNDAAAARFAEAFPNAKRMLFTFNRYLDDAIPVMPDGAPVRAVTAGDVVEFYKRPPRSIGPDDVLDFQRDSSGMAALLEGQWSSFRHDRVMMPTLSKAGSRHIQAKLLMNDAMNWADDGILRLSQRLSPEDFESAESAGAVFMDAMRTSANSGVNDSMGAISRALTEKGYDGETVLRYLNREVARIGNVQLLPGEAIEEGIVRTIVTAFDEMQADQLRGLWQTGLSAHLGEAAAAHIDEVETTYRRALGLTGDVDDLVDRTMDLDHAVSMAASAPTDAGVRRARGLYEQSLLNRGANEDEVRDALGAFDMLQAERRNAAAILPVSTVDPDLANNMSRWLVLPLAKALHAPVRFARVLAQHVPKESFLALDGHDTPIVLEQLLNFGVRGRASRELFGQFLREGEAGRRLVVRNIYREMFDRMGILNDPAYDDFVSGWLASTDQMYGADDIIKSVMGEHHAGFLDGHAVNAVAIPRFREIDAQVKRGRFLQLLNGSGNKVIGINSQAADRFMSLWRTSVVLRPAMIPRAGGEELLAQYARWGPSHIFRQQVVGRMLKPRIAGEMSLSELNSLLYGDAMEATLGIPHSPVRNFVHAVSERLSDDMSKLAGKALSRQEKHAMRMMATDKRVQEAFGEVSGVNAGLVPMAKQGVEEPGRYFMEIIDHKTGEPVLMKFRPGGGYKEMDFTDPFFRQHLSGRWMEYSRDEPGRLAMAYLGLDYSPAQADRIAAIAKAEGLGVKATGEEVASAHVLNGLREGFANMPESDLDTIIEWLDTMRDAPFPARKISKAAMRSFDESILGGSMDKKKLQRIFEQLDWTDRNAILSMSPDLGGIPSGYLGTLMDGPMFRGTRLNAGDDALLFGSGQTWDDVHEMVGVGGRSGSGVYLTSSGRYAELFQHGDMVGTSPSAGSRVTRLRFKDGVPPKLIDGEDLDHVTAIKEAGSLMGDDYLGLRVDTDTAAVLRYAMEDGLGAMQADEAFDIAIDIGMEPEAAERVRTIVGSMAWDEWMFGRRPAETNADALKVIRSNLGRLDEALTAGLGHPASEAQLDVVYNRLYGERIVKPFTAKGYRGVADHHTAADHTPMALWHPGDLEVVGEIPYAESMMHRAQTQRAATLRRRLSDSVFEADPARRRQLLRDQAREQVIRVLTRPDRQHKLRRFDRMVADVAQGPAKGMIRLQMPIIPDDVLRRVADHARVSTLDKAGMDVAVGQGALPAMDRAGLLGHVGSPFVRRYFDDLLERMDAADPAQPAQLLTSRAATSDPTMAKQMLEEAQALVRRFDPEGAELVHLGFVDLTGAEFRSLADAGAGSGGRLADDIAEATATRSADLAEMERAGSLGDLVENPRGIERAKGRPSVVSAQANRLVTGGSQTKWLDNDFVLNRAVSMATDRAVVVAADLDDVSRGYLLDALRGLREDSAAFAERGGRGGVWGGVNQSGERIPAVAHPRTDEDMLFEFRNLLDEGLGTLSEDEWRQMATVLLGGENELARVAFQRGIVDDTLDQRQLLADIAGGDLDPVAERTLDALDQMPKDALPYVLEPHVPAGSLPHGLMPSTRWAMADGRTWQQAVEEMADTIVRNAEAVAIGAQDNVLHGVVRPMATGKYHYAKHVEGRDLGALPLTVTGPQLAKVDEVSKARKAADRGLDWIGRGISSMARTPIYRRTFADALDDAYAVLRPAMTDAITKSKAAGHLDDIEEAGDLLYETAAAVHSAGGRMDDMMMLETLIEGGHYNPGDSLFTWLRDEQGNVKRILKRTELSDGEKDLVRWWRQEQAMRDEAVQIASVRAVDATIPFIDDHRVRSQFAEKIRNVIPFFFAEEQFYKRWARTFIHSPEAFRRLTLAHNAFRSVGWLDENEYGEEVFMYPGAQYVGKALAGFLEVLPMDSKWTTPISPMLQGQLSFAAPGFDRIGMPSAGPVAAIPLRALRAVMPEVAMPLEKAILGPRGVGRSLPEMILPSALYRPLRFATTGDEDLHTAVIGAIQMLEANHPEFVPAADASPEEVDEYLERLRNHARVMIMTKALLGTTLPASPQIDYDPEGLSSEFVGYLNAGVPMEEATANFLRDHPDATPFTIFSTETPSKAPVDPTEETYQEILNNGDFYDDHRAAGPWLLPAGAPDAPFDRQAWHEMLAHKIRTRKTDIEFYQDLKYAEAAEVYYESQREKNAALEKATTASDRKNIKDSWRTWSDEYKARHRIFATQMSGQTSQDRRRAVIADMHTALQDSRRPEVEHADLLRELLDGFDEYQQVRARFANDNRTSADRYKQQLRATFIEWAEDFSARHPTALIFWRRILLPEVDPGRGYAAELEGENDEEEAA